MIDSSKYGKNSPILVSNKLICYIYQCCKITCRFPSASKVQGWAQHVLQLHIKPLHSVGSSKEHPPTPTAGMSKRTCVDTSKILSKSNIATICGSKNEFSIIYEYFTWHIKLNYALYIKHSVNCMTKWHVQSAIPGSPRSACRFHYLWFIMIRHDNVIKWKNFPRFPFVRGIHQSPVNSSHKGLWRGALMFSLICAHSG